MPVSRVTRPGRTSIPSGGRVALLRIPLNFVNDESTHGELPENAKINETDTFGQGEDGEAYFEFGDADSEEDSDDPTGANNKKDVDIDDI